MLQRLCLPLVLASISGSALGDELWRQDHADCAVNPSHCFGGISSQDARNPGGLGWMYETVDNFDAAAPWTITNLEFWGAQATLTPAVTDGFMIRFYSDNAGQVGPLLLTQDVFTFTQDTYFTWSNPNFPASGFRYTLNLAQPFTLPAAGRYWMSIVGIQPYGRPDDRQWGWNLSNTIHGPVCQQSGTPPGNYAPQFNDVAFVLFGDPGATVCYANCDLSTTAPILNANDFQCFLNTYAAGNTAANCDGSTAPPILNANDFQCFLNAFAAGCS